MVLKKGELKVFYAIENGIYTELDTQLEHLLADFGYERWASGCTMTDQKPQIRDLAFQKRKEE